MGIAFLLLGLLPLVFMSDLFDNDDEPNDFVDQIQANPVPLDGDPADDPVDLLDDPATQEPETLAPLDEDDPPDDGTQDPDPADILQPVIEDDTASAPDGDAGDALLPVDQIDSDADSIWINFDDDAGLGYSEIEDFQAGFDVLHVLISPESVTGELDVEVSISENGLDAMVYIEQQLVAILKGAPDATVFDVVVEIGGIAS